MERSAIAKLVAVLVGLAFIFVALCIAARHDLLGSLLHKLSSPKYAAYSFSSYEDGRFYTVGPVIRADGEIDDGDIGSPVKFCPLHGDWVCLDGPTFKFAVPRQALKVGDHWNFSGVEYTLLPTYMEVIPGGPVPGSEAPLWHYRILGRQYALYAIQTESREIFLFSPDHGLIGYMALGDASVKDDVRNATFWLEGENGPGSMEFDSSIANKAFLSPNEVKALEK